MQKEEIASLLKTTPEAQAAFEAVYQKQAAAEVSDNLFDLNAKDAASSLPSPHSGVCQDEIIDRIVDELLGKAKVLVYKDNQLSTITFPTPDLLPVTPADLADIDRRDMPQLIGSYGMRDIPDSSAVALFFYQGMLNAKSEKEKRFCYDHFRQGLDILDIDPLLYEIIGTNRNSMGYWLPSLLKGVEKQGFFKVPETSVLKVPLPLLQLTRLPYDGLRPPTIKILDRFCMRAFDLDVRKDYFIKTGTYSSKYNFRNTKVTGEEEVRELGEYLLFIHFQACQIASPFTEPTVIYGASTTNEWVVRDFIPDKTGLPCIYNGMPLRTVITTKKLPSRAGRFTTIGVSYADSKVF